jgi:hypothetical protein
MNCTFYFQGAQKAITTVYLVIADILEGLPVPGILIPPFLIPSWDR